MIRISISNSVATVTETEVLAAGRVGLECAFTFGAEWSGLAKVAVFEGAETIEVALGTSDVAVVPPECMSTPGYNLRIGAYGLDAGEAVVIPTVWAKAGKIKDSAAPDDESFAPATPELVAQIIQTSNDAIDIARRIEAAAAAGDFDGVSPEATVTKSGKVATISITDRSGTTSASISDGASAYEQAVEGGYVGSETDFNTDLAAFKDLATQSAYNAGVASDKAAAASDDADDAAEAKTDAEAAQGLAESAQTAAETAQGKAEDAQNAAETAQGKAEDAQGAAETAQGKAEDAQTAAETAQGLAEAAQSAAESAQTAAETAQDKAEDAQTAAETAQAAAEAVLESIPEDYTELTNRVEAVTEDEAVETDGLEARGLYINGSKLSTITGDRLIAIPAKGVKLFHLTCTVSSTKRVAFANSVANNAAVYDKAEYTGQLDADAVNASDSNYLVIQLFINSDSVQDAETYLEALTVTVPTAVDGTARADTAEIRTDVTALQRDAEYLRDGVMDETIPFGVWDSGSGGGISVVQAGETVTLNGTSTAASSQAYTKILICDHVQCWNNTNTPDAASVFPIRTIAGRTYRATADIISGTREKGDGSGIIRLMYIFDGSGSVYKNIGIDETHGEMTFTSDGAGLRLMLGASRLTSLTDVVVRVMLRDVTAEKALALDEIAEEIEAESIAEITGEVGDTWDKAGITFTKTGDHEFTLTGNSTATIGKGFNVLLGSDEVVSNGATGMQTNISEPGVYTLAYETSGADYSSYLFAVTEGAFDKKRYVRSGESFVVEDDPVCLFAYASTTIKLGTKTLDVKWALYKGEEYKGFPYTEDGIAVSAVDLVARNAGGESGVNPMYQEYVSWGKANALANARHIINIKWTPTGSTMVKGKDTYYEEGVEYQGIPYSSVRDSNKFVGIDVSLHTFMTAVNDPRSVLYTRRSTTQNANCYYGSVCSTFCDYAYGIRLYLSNYYLGTCDLFDDVPLQDLQKGDLLYKPGHVMMCVDVTKDDYGRIATLTVWEEWAPNGRAKYYRGLDKFVSARPGYIARRYKYLSGVPYTQTPYVRCFDEEEADIVYPDVQTDHGDAAVFAEGENVVIHVLDAKDYSSIVVTRGSTTVRTVTTIADFTVENAEPGLYTVTAVGTNNSVSTFYVVDMNCSLDAETHVLSFASTNATPTIVYVYGLDEEDGKVKPVGSPGTPLILTDADRTAGSIDLSDYISETCPYAKIAFLTDYGTAMWYSETHERWEPVT